jgi:hypothetical protein
MLFQPSNDQSYAATTENTTRIDPNDTINLLSTTNKKHSVHLQLMHHRLGHRSIESLLLGNSDNIWNDITVQKDQETVCETCQITLARRAARNRIHPGTMVMVDIISNTFDFGLTIKSHFRYFILFVDVFSSFPVLLGINDQSATTVIRTLQLYHAMFCPTVDRTNAAQSELNLSNLQHIRADAGTQFTSAAFIQSCNDKGIKVSVAAPKHQEQNGLCEHTWQLLRNLAFSFMNYARVGEEFGDLALEHAWKVFGVLPLKNLCKNGVVTTPFELYYNRKPSIRKFRVLFCPCVYKVYFREKTTSKQTRRFDSSNHPQRGVIGIFCGFPRGQTGLPDMGTTIKNPTSFWQCPI